MFISAPCVSGGLEQDESGGEASGEPEWSVAGAETPSCPVCLSETQRQAKAGESLTVKSLFLFSYISNVSAIMPKRPNGHEKAVNTVYREHTAHIGNPR